MKKITFIIGQDGSTKLQDAEGFGASCTEATRPLEQRLGAVDESTRGITDNYYQQEGDGTISLAS